MASRVAISAHNGVDSTNKPVRLAIYFDRMLDGIVETGFNIHSRSWWETVANMPGLLPPRRAARLQPIAKPTQQQAAQRFDTSLVRH